MSAVFHVFANFWTSAVFLIFAKFCVHVPCVCRVLGVCCVVCLLNMSSGCVLFLGVCCVS